MTVIAWDGTTLAADRRTSNSGMIGETTKIWRRDGCLVGGAGEHGSLMTMIEWIFNGRNSETFPASQRDKDDWAHVIVVHPTGKVEVFERFPYPALPEQKCIAVGSGQEFARAAMYLGKTAREAVEVAIALNTGCGNGIDTLTLQVENGDQFRMDAPTEPVKWDKAFAGWTA